MDLSPSISWILEFMIFLLRQFYIHDRLENSSGRCISLFKTNGATQPTPLIFFFHIHLSNTLIKALWLIRLIKMYTQVSIGKSSPDLLSDDQKISLKILNNLESTGLSENMYISFLLEVQKLINPEPESILRSMWITGQLPSSYQSKMDSFFALFSKCLPKILPNGNDLFKNTLYLQLWPKRLNQHCEYVVDVKSKKRILPLYFCGHCGHYSVNNVDLCVCGGALFSF